MAWLLLIDIYLTAYIPWTWWKNTSGPTRKIMGWVDAIIYALVLVIHHKFTELFSLLFVDGNPAGVKCLLHAMGHIENELRLPLVPTRITTYENIRHVLERL